MSNTISEIELAQNSTLDELIKQAYTEENQLAMAICLNIRCDIECALGSYLWCKDEDVEEENSLPHLEKEFTKSIQKLMRVLK